MDIARKNLCEKTRKIERKKSRHKHYLANRIKLLTQSKRYNQLNRQKIKNYRKFYNKVNKNFILSQNKMRREEVKKLLSEWKSLRGCVVCGERDSRCLDCHHVNPAKKLYDIASAGCRLWKTIQLELEKCIVLCANCHRKKHWE